VLGTSSGIHDWHSKYYYRRIRLGKNEALYSYLNIYHPEMLEDDFFMPHLQSIVKIPQKAPEGALLREETTALSLLERIKTVNKYWIKPGHRKGPNMHNVSATVNIKPNEWETAGEWIYSNKKYFTALSFLPEDLGTYTQAPFETITKEEYEEAVKSLHDIDLTKVVEITDNTSVQSEIACGASGCEIM
jgi:ribonucleoside-diphosphate reductase alpha chain